MRNSVATLAQFSFVFLVTMTPICTHAQQRAEISANDKNAVVLMLNGQTVNEDGQRKQFVVTGNSNKIRITGDCKSFTLSGSENEVELDRVGSINLIGRANRVTYSGGVDGSEPVVSTVGGNDQITKREAENGSGPGNSPGVSGTADSQASASNGLSAEMQTETKAPDQGISASLSSEGITSSGPGPVLFDKAGGEHRSLNISNQDAILNSENNDLTLSGSVATLIINSGGNQVVAEKVSRIVLNGDNNHVTYSASKNQAKPNVLDNGHGNTVISSQ